MDGETCVGIFTLRPIAPGEELTYDYNFETFSEKKQRCLCGSVNCRGWLTRASEAKEQLRQAALAEQLAVGKNGKRAKGKSKKIAGKVGAGGKSGAASSLSSDAQERIAARALQQRIANLVPVGTKRDAFEWKPIAMNLGFITQGRVFAIRNVQWMRRRREKLSEVVCVLMFMVAAI